jgi:hypothetical protein
MYRVRAWVRGLEAVVARGACAGGLDGAKVEYFELLGAFESALDPAEIDHRREVEQGSRHRGDRDAVLGCSVLRVEAAEVDLQAATGATSGRSRDVDPGAVVRREPEQVAGAAVAEVRVVAAAEGGRHPAALDGDVVVPDRIHAALDPVKATDRDAVLDLMLPQPELEQLRSRDHSVLAGRDLGDQHVDVCYAGLNYSSSRHARRIGSLPV